MIMLMISKAMSGEDHYYYKEPNEQTFSTRHDDMQHSGRDL